MGVYCVDKSDITANETMSSLLSEYGTLTLAFITFTYTGKTFKCIYGEDHTGYLVIPVNIPSSSILSIKETTYQEYEKGRVYYE